MQHSEEAGVHLVTGTVGFVAFVLLWLAVVWGLVLRHGWMSTRVRHQTMYGAHQVLALTSLTLAAVHAFALLAVPGTYLRLVNLLVPFSYWRDPIGIGTAALALEVLTAVTLSILVQRRIGHTRWRMMHKLTYPAFTLVVAHILISGTDTFVTWMWTAVVLAWLVTVGLWLTTVPWLVDGWRRITGRLTTRLGNQEVVVNVDPTRCARFGFCEHEAPAVFVLRSDGLLSHRAAVRREELPVVARAREVCPTRAITINEPPTGSPWS